MSNDDGRIGHVLVARPKGIGLKYLIRLIFIGIKNRKVTSDYLDIWYECQSQSWNYQVNY